LPEGGCIKGKREEGCIRGCFKILQVVVVLVLVLLLLLLWLLLYVIVASSVGRLGLEIFSDHIFSGRHSSF